MSVFASLFMLLSAGDVRPWSSSRSFTPLAQDTVDVDEEISSAKLELPSNVRVLYVLRGGEQEHLGLSAAVVGDLDRDGVRDFVLGGMGHGFIGYGPGGVRAYSALTGLRLWELRGSRRGGSPSKGDAFGSRVCALGDVDGDGVEDVAIGACRFANDRGMVRIVSGASGREVATLYGPSHGSEVVVCRGGGVESDDASPGDAERVTHFGAFLASAADLDGDGARDLLIGEDWLFLDGRCWAISAKTLATLFHGRGIPLGMTGDVDRDGHADVAALQWRGPETEVAPVVLSSRGGQALVAPLRFLLRAGQNELATGGDLDGDGFLDFARVAHGEREHSVVASGVAERALRRFTLISNSGVGGDELFRADLGVRPASARFVADACGDLDGDGRSEIRLQIADHPLPTTIELRSGDGGALLHTLRAANSTFGDTLLALDDLDGDGRPEWLVTECEASEPVACSGRTWVLSSR